MEETTPTLSQSAEVVGAMDEVEDTPHPSQLAGVVVLAEVEEEGYPLMMHTTCWVMVRVPQEKRVTKNPLRKRRSRPNLVFQRPNEGLEVWPDRQRHPKPST